MFTRRCVVLFSTRLFLLASASCSPCCVLAVDTAPGTPCASLLPALHVFVSPSLSPTACPLPPSPPPPTNQHLGAHDCCVRYIGSTSFGNGTWYGIEMGDGQLGRNNGTVDGVRYFDTASGGKTALFVQRGRLSEANRARDLEDLGTLRGGAHSVGAPVNIAEFSSKLGTTPRDSSSLSPERTTARRMRTKSSINPREIEQAMDDRRKEKLIQKRSRNRTSLNPGAPPSPESMSKFSDDVAHHVSVREQAGRSEVFFSLLFFSFYFSLLRTNENSFNSPLPPRFSRGSLVCRCGKPRCAAKSCGCRRNT